MVGVTPVVGGMDDVDPDVVVGPEVGVVVPPVGVQPLISDESGPLGWPIGVTWNGPEPGVVGTMTTTMFTGVVQPVVPPVYFGFTFDAIGDVSGFPQ